MPTSSPEMAESMSVSGEILWVKDSMSFFECALLISYAG